MDLCSRLGRPQSRCRDSEGGAAIVLVTIVLTALLGLLALAVDISLFAKTKEAASASGDFASLAALREFTDPNADAEAAQAAAQYVLNANLTAGGLRSQVAPAASEQAPEIVLTGTNPFSLSITQHRLQPLTFGRLIGRPREFEVRSAASFSDPRPNGEVGNLLHLTILLENDSFMAEHAYGPGCPQDAPRCADPLEYPQADCPARCVNQLHAAREYVKTLIRALDADDHVTLHTYGNGLINANRLVRTPLSTLAGSGDREDLLAVVDDIRGVDTGARHRVAAMLRLYRDIDEIRESPKNAAVILISSGYSRVAATGAIDLDLNPFESLNEDLSCLTELNSECESQARSCIDQHVEDYLAAGFSWLRARFQARMDCAESRTACVREQPSVLEESIAIILRQIQLVKFLRVYSVSPSNLDPTALPGERWQTDQGRRRDLLLELADDKTRVRTRPAYRLSCNTGREPAMAGRLFNPQPRQGELDEAVQQMLRDARRDDDGLSRSELHRVPPHLIEPPSS